MGVSASGRQPGFHPDNEGSIPSTPTMSNIDYFHIIAVQCDCCGEMVKHYSGRGGAWFEKYLLPEEDVVCRRCIKGRPGYAEEFLEKIGIPVDEFPE